MTKLIGFCVKPFSYIIILYLNILLTLNWLQTLNFAMGQKFRFPSNLLGREQEPQNTKWGNCEPIETVNNFKKAHLFLGKSQHPLLLPIRALLLIQFNNILILYCK